MGERYAPDRSRGSHMYWPHRPGGGLGLAKLTEGVLTKTLLRLSPPPSEPLGTIPNGPVRLRQVVTDIVTDLLGLVPFMPQDFLPLGLGLPEEQRIPYQIAARDALRHRFLHKQTKRVLLTRHEPAGEAVSRFEARLAESMMNATGILHFVTRK